MVLDPITKKMVPSKTEKVPANHNSLPEINNVLARLGITHRQINDHEHHFHVDFRTPKRVPITQTQTNALVTDMNIQSAVINTISSDVIQNIALELGVNPEDLMLTTPVEANLAEHPQVVVAPVSAVSVSSATSPSGIGTCLAIQNRANDDQPGGGVGPARMFRTYLYLQNMELPPKNFQPDVKVISAPKHGVLKEQPNTDGTIYRTYVPDVGYLGDDKIVYSVTYEGKTVKVVYVLKVTDLNVGGNFIDDIVCKGMTSSWLLTSGNVTSPTTTITYSNLLNDALGAFKGFTDLPASEVGTTTGEGANAAITLDVNAAGNGWYQSANPFDNSDLLPTADANIWVAKAGSVAAGKMDLLSVLLHEYGHALGLDHSTAATDAMAATLKVGERRVWTEAELAQVTSRYTSLWRALASE